jgi:hypothetical protein
MKRDRSVCVKWLATYMTGVQFTTEAVVFFSDPEFHYSVYIIYAQVFACMGVYLLDPYAPPWRGT